MEKKEIISVPLEMDSESGCDAVSQLSTGLSGIYVHVISTRNLHISGPSPINHHAMLGRHRQNHQEKTLWSNSSIKSNCHAESLQQAALH